MEGIQHLKNLRRLALCSGVDDLSPVADLTDLRSLVVQESNTRDLAPLAELKNLQRLEIRGSDVSDLSPLEGLQNLESIVISNSRVTDLSPLRNLTKLNRLFLHSNNISNIRPLANLNNLTVLNISNNNVSNVLPLANMQKLHTLYIANNNVSDIEPLTTIPNLRGLDLRNNPLSNEMDLQELEHLQWVDFGSIPVPRPAVPEECIVRSQETGEISMSVNGECIDMDQPPVTEEGCTRIPLRAVIEAMGGEISWDAVERAAVGTVGDVSMIVPVGTEYAMVDGRSVNLFYPTQIVNGRTMIHSRLLVEAFGARTHWDAESRTILIDTE